jgi:hypothetical protein
MHSQSRVTTGGAALSLDHRARPEERQSTMSQPARAEDELNQLHKERSSVGLEVDGMVAGALAGAVMLGASIVMAGLAERSVLLPLRYAASAIMGSHALTAPALLVMLVGVLVHLSVAMLYGFLFGLVEAELGRRAQRSMARQIALGAGAGALFWLVDIPLVARWFYPWVAAEPTWVVLPLHVLAFGVPLGVFYALIQQRRISNRIWASDTPPLPSPGAAPRRR